MSGNQNQKIVNFFNKLDRSFFIDNEFKCLAHCDRPLPIGFGQTISQPSLVLYMTIELDLDRKHKVLEIGTGSGYQTVFLAEFAGEVFTVELIEELSRKAQEKLTKLGYNNIRFKIADGSKGWEEFAPYDRIMVTAGAGKMPKALLFQLKPGGKMVVPVGHKGEQELVLIEKKENGDIREKSLGPVAFVEFRGTYGWDDED